MSTIYKSQIYSLVVLSQWYIIYVVLPILEVKTQHISIDNVGLSQLQKKPRSQSLKDQINVVKQYTTCISCQYMVFFSSVQCGNCSESNIEMVNITHYMYKIHIQNKRIYEIFSASKYELCLNTKYALSTLYKSNMERFHCFSCFSMGTNSTYLPYCISFNNK